MSAIPILNLNFARESQSTDENNLSPCFDLLSAGPLSINSII